MTSRFRNALGRGLGTLALVALALAPRLARAQDAAPPPPAATLMRASAAPLTAAAGTTAEVTVSLEVKPGWHVNANPPSSEEMIPTTVELMAQPGLSPGATRYPAGARRKLSFADEELLVYDGTVLAHLPVTIARDVAPGRHTLAGKLRFQPCNDQLCLPPATVPFQVELEVGAAAAGATGPAASTAGAATGAAPESVAGAPATRPDTAAAGGAGFTTAPPAGGAATRPVAGTADPIARLFERGSFLAFLGLFLIGLALNLTPCVYPMLGVTVSIFGSRESTAPLKAFLLACVYVLGMATMYSALGVVAALTGTLFGGWLSSPWVLLGIGVLLAALALSMFGLYEINPPYWLLSRLGGSGATSIAGIFLSGLVVGVFAAPCTGPPVVALLALVGAKADPVFGFLAFFVLALGLGAPYLVLGTFSNLLGRLPRSGTWMVWVKKVFGTIMIAVAAFYALLALRPEWSAWVLPAALLAGGVYLGFVERSVRLASFRRMQMLGGALAIAGGLALIATAPARPLAFEPYTPEAVAAARAAGQPVMIDFSADWCIPCHELERNTFTDRTVIARAKGFRRVAVDLTHFDSEESQRLRQAFGVSGVPTIVFLAPDGHEVRAARVEGFLPPKRFLERIEVALAGGS